MRLLLAVSMMIAATAAEAQYGGYPPPPPGYPAPPGYQPPPAYPPYASGSPADQPPYQAAPMAQPGGDARSLARETLAPQNAVRATVDEAPLRWSDRLADAAQAWADQLLATGQFVHRPGNPHGENLYAITGGSASPQQVVDAWAEEARNYDIRSNTCSGTCGHYAQIVWRSTQ